MSDVLREHAKMLARNLLRLQVCTIGEIAETLELEPPEVQQLAVEVYDERAEQLTALRQIMNDINEGRHERQQQEALLFDAIGILNQCLHRREPGRGEIADIRNWIHNMADHDLALYLDKLYTGGNDGEILIHGRVFLDNVYALFMRTHYDDLRRHDDDFNEPDTTAAPPADAAAAEAYARDEARDDAFLDGYDHGHRDAREEIASRLLQQSRLPFPSIAGYTGLTDDEVRQLAARVLKR
jgi:hypothetical protein|nr:MAG TPA: hypothetical protein [Caudoviricetes sp.]